MPIQAKTAVVYTCPVWHAGKSLELRLLALAQQENVCVHNFALFNFQLFKFKFVLSQFLPPSNSPWMINRNVPS